MTNKKKKTEPLFAYAKRGGYDTLSVEAYIAAEREKSERAGNEQKERIAALKAQCAALAAELENYRDKEDQIKNALISANEKSDKMLIDIKFRYAMELERLKLFRAKWTSAYDEIKDRYHFSKDALNMESVAVSTKLEIERFLAQDFSIEKGDGADIMEAEFKSEAERLSETDSKVKELKEKLIYASERKIREEKRSLVKNPETAAAAFSIEDAQHPTESLAEICQYLGLGK